MLVDFICSLPSWILAVTIVGIATSVALIGQYVIRSFIPDEVRELNNYLVLGIGQNAGVIFGIVAGFVAASALGAFNKADSIVTAETNASYTLWLDSRAYAPDYETKVRSAVEEYLHIVINDEWPVQAQGKESMQAVHACENLYRLLIDYVPTSEAQQTVHTQNLDQLNALFDARHRRIFMNSHGLNEVVYYEIILSAIVVFCFAWFFSSKFPKGHLWLNAILGISIGLVLYLIVVFDYPFRGQISVSPKPYQKVLDNFQRLSIEQPPSSGI